MSIRGKRLISVSAAVVLSVLAAAENAAQAPTGGDNNAYARLHLVAKQTGATANKLDFGKCPESGYSDFNLADLIKGNKVYDIAVEVKNPSNVPPLQFGAVHIEHKKAILSGRCLAHSSEFDYRSPLFSVAQYKTMTFTVTPMVTRRVSWSDTISQTIGSAVTALGMLSVIPAPLIPAANDKVRDLVANQGDLVAQSNGVVLTINDPVDPDLHAWTIDGDADANLPPMKIEATLERVESIFSRPNAGWSPDEVLSAKFPLIPGASSLKQYLNNNAAAVSFNDAQNTEQAKLPCKEVHDFLQQSGLTPNDQALTLWALVRSQPAIGDTPQADELACMATYWPLLPKEIVKRTTPQFTGPPARAQMQSAVEISPGLRDFLILSVWTDRQAAGKAVLAEPLIYQDDAQLGWQKQPKANFDNVDQWFPLLQDPARPLARKLGCLIYQPADPADKSGSSTALMIALLVTGDAANPVDREALLRLTFAPVIASPASSPARPKIARLEVTIQPTAAEILAIQTAHPTDCGDGVWKPALAYPAVPKL